MVFFCKPLAGDDVATGILRRGAQVNAAAAAGLDLQRRGISAGARRSQCQHGKQTEQRQHDNRLFAHGISSFAISLILPQGRGKASLHSV